MLETLLALVALVIALRANSQIRTLTQRLDRMQAGQGEPTPEAHVAPAAPQAVPETPPLETPPDAPQPTRMWGRRRATTGPHSDRIERFGTWLKANWIYPVAGLALVMAAVFLVQYSIEKGLLSPALRIGLALALGAALIAAAEVLRHRWNEAQAGLVPATLAGAGSFTLFAAILAAHHLYAMLGAESALAALALTAALAIVLGWAHGPMQAAIGVIGGAAAPFLLASNGPPPPLLFGYFGAVAALGLGIDGLRRWGWVSGLAVLLPLVGGALIVMAGAPSWGMALLALWVVALGTTLPGGKLVPGAEGPMVHRKGRKAPETWVAALAVLVAVLAVLSQVKAPESLLCLGLLAILLPLWTARAPALSDLSLVAAAGLPLAVAGAGITTPLFLAFTLNTDSWLPVTSVALGALAALAMLWRSARAEGRARDLWALLAVATPGATLVAAEVFWKPMTLLDTLWPATAMALAAFYTATALWAARRDSGQGARLGAAAAGAFACMALALMLVLSAAALTVALAVLLVAAAAMDRRFAIPYLGWIIGLGAMALGWRLVVDPGIDAVLNNRLSNVDTWLTLVAVLAGPLAALALIRGLPAHPARDWGRVIAETGVSGMVPIVIALILARFFDDITPHAGTGIEATVLIALAWVQRARARAFGDGRAMIWVRRGLAAVLALVAALCLIALMTLVSPVFGGHFLGGDVRGWPVLNDLILGYALPAAALWAVARGNRWVKAAALVLAATWVALVIRHLWHGGVAMDIEIADGFRQGELYAYTVALLATGALVMALALRLGRTQYRVAGLALIGFAAAKAFLIDASGLHGLMRVGAFLGLGLTLVCLAWLNTWIAARMTPRNKAE